MKHVRILGALLILVSALSVQTSAGALVLVAVTPATLPQGGAVAVTVRGAVPEGTLQVGFASRTWPLYWVVDHWQTYLGTDPGTTTGVRPVVVELEQGDGFQVLARRSVTVRRVTFPQRHLTFDPQTIALLTPEKAAEEHAKVGAALQTLEPTQLWSGPYKMPVDGTITSGYGVASFYLGTPQGWHTGVDIAAAEGVTVYAANAGIVRLAEPLPLSGDTVILDHGMGILTFYMHMSAIDVVAGQHVHTGEILGRVGSTGLATGPHLHWGVRVNGIYVNPLLWSP